MYCLLCQEFISITQESVEKKLVTDAREKYEATYREEKKLNENFNTFVTNYQLAYQGPNTLKEQIDASVKSASKRCECTHVPKLMFLVYTLKRLVEPGDEAIRTVCGLYSITVKNEMFHNTPEELHNHGY